MRFVIFPVILIGCGLDIKLDPIEATCNGKQDSTEESVDSPYDKDGDGSFDASNIDCQEAYTITELDCDDNNPDIAKCR
jgi:hypothetical protein